jgi:chorismate dehydratase
MSVPIAMIPYTNMAPYRQLGAPEGCHFVPLTPRDSISALAEGTIAAAAVPVGGLTKLEGKVETVGRFGIAAKGPSMSVLLFSRIPFEEMHAPQTLRVTAETASSVRLTYLLFGYSFGFDRLPYLATEDITPDGQLLIGDRGLVRGQTMKMGDEFFHVTDLSERWLQVHQLPFVFARWVVKKDAPAALKETIGRWLETFREKEPMLVEKSVAPSARDLGVTPAVVKRYFSVIRRCLDEEDIRGQQRFFREMEKYDRQPLFRLAG